jgi:hypothetical protein
MKMAPEFTEVLLRRYYNPHEDVDCGCGMGKQLVHCWECFQYPVACANCFVKRHRHLPFHWAQVWVPEKRIWIPTDYSSVLPESDKAIIQLGHLDEENHCSANEKPLDFTVIHTNGIHSTRIRFCHCDASRNRSIQLTEADLFPATPDKPETAFTFAMLEEFQTHNLQSKATPFDWMMSLRRLTNDVTTHKVPVCYAT